MAILLFLARLIGVERIVGWSARLVVWVARLVWLGFVVGILGTISYFIYRYFGNHEPIPEPVQIGAGVIVILLLIRAVLLISRNKREPIVIERTIDGKVVPNMLAAAALPVPSQSPTGEYVLRGLPDYGKTLLKLNSADFEYVPELEEPSPVEEPVVSRTGWFPNLLRLFGAGLRHIFEGKPAVPLVNEHVVERGPHRIPRWVPVTAMALVAVGASAGLVTFGVRLYQQQQIEKANKEAANKAALDKAKQDAESAEKASQQAEYRRQRQAALDQAKLKALDKEHQDKIDQANQEAERQRQLASQAQQDAIDKANRDKIALDQANREAERQHQLASQAQQDAIDKANRDKIALDQANREAERQRQLASQAQQDALNKQPLDRPYSGPTSGNLSCPGSPIVQNGEVVFRNLPPARLRLTYDSKIWVATFLPGEGGTQRLVLRNIKPGRQKSCTVHWELER